MGLDPNEMAATITEDYNNRTETRWDQGRALKEEARKNRDENNARLQAEKEGALGILRSDFEKQAGERTGRYDAKMAAQQKELDGRKSRLR